MRIDDGRQAFYTLWNGPNQRPTAVLAANDMLAIGVQWAARNEGVSLPQELSIIGFGDMPLAAQISLPLTTIALARYELGTTMMRMLLDLLQTDADEWLAPTPCKHVETHLIVRQSTTLAPPSDDSYIQVQR